MHVGSSITQVAQGRNLEKPYLCGIAVYASNSRVRSGRIESVVPRSRSGERFGSVAVHAGPWGWGTSAGSCSKKQSLALVFLSREIGEGRYRCGYLGTALIIARAVAHHAAHKLRKGLTHAQLGYLDTSKGIVKKQRVVWCRIDSGEHRINAQSHFDRILNGHQHLVFKTRSALVPKKCSIGVESSV